MYVKINIFILVSICLGLNLDAEKSYVTYQGSHPAHSWEGTSKEIVSSLSCSDADAKQGCVLEIEIPILLKSLTSDDDLFLVSKILLDKVIN